MDREILDNQLYTHRQYGMWMGCRCRNSRPLGVKLRIGR
jgi:hypothetical protein